MAETTDMVGSGADLAASFTPDSGATEEVTSAAAPVEIDIEDPASPDAEGGDLDLDTLNDPGSEVQEEVEVAGDESLAEAAVEEPVLEELPEGVRRGKDRKGKDGFWLEPSRYETFHAAHKTLRGIEELIGEPFSIEAIALRDRAYAGQERLYSDFLSGDPKQQGQVIKHLFDEAKRAQQEGEVGLDPLVPFTEQLYSTLQKASPDAYASLRRAAANDLVDEMYAEAAANGTRALWLSAQHFDKILGRRWKPETDMANYAGPDDPVAQLRAENEKLRSQISNGTATSSAAQFDAWRTAVNGSITKTVTDEAILPALDSVKESYAKYPDTWQAIQARLHSKVSEGFKEDKRFAERVHTLTEQAKRAPSAQRRQEIAEQVQLLHKNKAKLIVEAHKATVLSEAAARLKEQSDATHKRLQAAQKQRAPGSGSPVRRSLLPTNGEAMNGFDTATPESLRASLAGLFKQ